MKKPFLFTDVRQEIKEFAYADFVGSIRIHFTLEGASFYLNIACWKGKKKNELGFVHHDRNLKSCPFCRENNVYTGVGVYCRALSDETVIHSLFDALIQEPTIRLEWLYLEHPKRMEIQNELSN